MSHLVLSTILPKDGEECLVTLYGDLEQEAVATLLEYRPFGPSSSSSSSLGPEARGNPPILYDVQGNQTRFKVPLFGSWMDRVTHANVMRVSFFDILETHGWIMRAANSTEPPQMLLRGIQTDLRIVECDGGASHDGDVANFLFFKGGGTELTGLEIVSSAAASYDPVVVSSQTPSESGGDAPMSPTSSATTPSSGTTSWSGSRSGGLTLPEVVMKVLVDDQALRWDASERCFEVVDGSKFEAQFNQLRKTRQKPKDGTGRGAVERPFSRMHNFFELEGDKWAKTGSIFRPKDLKRHFPTLETPARKGAKLDDSLCVQSVEAIQALKSLSRTRVGGRGAVI